MRTLLLHLLAIMLLSGNIAEAKSKTKFELNPSLTSRHYWRGIMVSRSVNIETDLILKNRNFTFGAWGGYALDNTYSEFNFHLGYNITPQLTFLLWDLYASRDRQSIDDYDYFDFDVKTTNHLYDASLIYSFGKKLPLTIALSTMVWGRDLDENNNQNYSTYLEFNYGVNVEKMKLTCFVGMNMFDNGAYAKKTNLVNVGVKAVKKVKIGELTIPVWSTVAINPDSKTANFILGIDF